MSSRNACNLRIIKIFSFQISVIDHYQNFKCDWNLKDNFFGYEIHG